MMVVVSTSVGEAVAVASSVIVLPIVEVGVGVGVDDASRGMVKVLTSILWSTVAFVILSVSKDCWLVAVVLPTLTEVMLVVPEVVFLKATPAYHTSP
jgi:hypothetical protein